MPILIKELDKFNVRGLRYAEYECSYCGNTFESVIAYVKSSLKLGRDTSCGCLLKTKNKNRMTKHGNSRDRIYKTFIDIKQRCYNKNCKNYKYYGERGICVEFKNFEHFREWALNNGYNDDLTIERIDVNKNYSENNCTWIEKKYQSRNMRSNKKITYKGKTQCVNAWAEEFCIEKRTLALRISRGWDIEKALNTKSNKRKYNHVVMYDYEGNFIKKYNTPIEASQETNIPSNLISGCCRGDKKSVYGYRFKYE